MSTAQPPQREQEDQLDPNTADQSAEAAKHRESSARVKPSGVKKGWDKKARRRHTVTSSKYTRDDKLPGHLSSSPTNTPDDKLPDHLPSSSENTQKTPAQQLVEEVFENVTVDELLSETPNDIELTEIQEETENVEDSKTHELSENTHPKAVEALANILEEEPAAESAKVASEHQVTKPDKSDPDDTEPIAIVTSEKDDKLPSSMSFSESVETSNKAAELEEGVATEEPVGESAAEEDRFSKPELIESFTTEHEHWPRKRNGSRHGFVATNYPDIEPIEFEAEAIETEEEVVEAEANSLLQALDDASHENKRVFSKEKAHFKLKKNKKEQGREATLRSANEPPEQVAAKSDQTAGSSEKKRRSWKPIKEPQQASVDPPAERKEPTKRIKPKRDKRVDQPQEQQLYTQRQKQQHEPARQQAKSQPVKSSKSARQQPETRTARHAESTRQKHPAKPAEATGQERSSKFAKPARQERPAKPEKPARQERPAKPVPRYRYIKSPTLEQAFRNLVRLNPGVAWRATRIPLVIFFVLFSILALAVTDQAPAIDALNASLNTAIQSSRGTLDTFFITLTTFGDPLPMIAICLVVCLILALVKKWDSLAFFITNTVLAAVFVQALKLIFAVPRPGDPTLVPIPGSFSFPSAHSFCSLIVFGMIGLLIFRALIRKGITRNVALVPGIILLVLALIIGISRIYVGVHWPSDVIGGWLLAGIWLPFAGALYTVGSRKPAKQAPIS